MSRASNRTFKGYDIIGDVHGCHVELERLLKRMGYAKRRGAWRHKDRFAVFVGDLVDRGPEIEAVLETVAAMLEAGSAVCIVGNHERDVVYFHTLGKNGKPIRERSESRTDQLKATHQQLGDKGRKISKWVKWMRALPILFEVPGLRVVHGAWNENAANFWRGKTLATPGVMDLLADKHSKPSSYLARLLFGPTMIHVTEDEKGKKRTHHVRARWYARARDFAAPTLWHAAFHRRKRWPKRPLTRDDLKALWGYSSSAPPLITGHQSLRVRAKLRPMRPNLACVDYSAVYGGRLCAYRWSGEPTLLAGNFVAVQARKRPRKKPGPKPKTPPGEQEAATLQPAKAA